MDRLEERFFGKPKRQHVKEFAALFATIFLAIGSWMIWKHNNYTWAIALSVLSVLLLVPGYKFPNVLLPVWEGWMKIAHAIGGFVTMIILSVSWILMVVPIALLLKIIGKKVLEMDLSKSENTYWDERDKKLDDFKLLERQF